MINLFPTWTKDMLLPKVSILGCSRNLSDQAHQDDPASNQPDHIGHFLIEAADRLLLGWITEDDKWLPDELATSYAQGRMDQTLTHQHTPDDPMIIPWDSIPNDLKTTLIASGQIPPELSEQKEQDDDLNTGQYL